MSFPVHKKYNDLGEQMAQRSIDMLTGRQLYLLRTMDKKMTREELSILLHVTYNEIVLYENGKKAIPHDIYERWLKIVID